MILILSEQHDTVTDSVLAWLNYYEIPFLRVNTACVVFIQNISISNSKTEVSFIYGSKKYNLSDFEIIWCRRGYLPVLKFQTPKLNNEDSILRQRVIENLSNEQKDLNDFVYNLFYEKSVISNPLKYNVNKLEVLSLAKKIGFNIPHTIVARNSKFVTMNLPNEIITKSISNMIPSEAKTKYEIWNQGTLPVSKQDLFRSKNFYYSLFQERVIKKFEVRVFFILQKFYASAIFDNSNSLVDIRNESKFTPNRVVPYVLPHKIKSMLMALMKKIKLNSGSIDIIVDDENKHYFLEVNPVGQFEWVSHFCNYNIEKDIAKILKTNYEKQKANCKIESHKFSL